MDRKGEWVKGRVGDKGERIAATSFVGLAMTGLLLNLKNMAKKEFSFNDAVSEIEEILQNIEGGELDVDKLSVEVKRASELIKQCQKKLKSTEDEINSIFRDFA